MAGLDERIMLAQNEIFDAFKGAITEQYILCELLAETSFIPYYWTNRAGTSEVDFVVQGDDGIIPIEVKSGINLKSKSLKVYMEKYVPDLAVRTSLADYKISEVPYENNKKSIGFVVDLPLYAFARQIGHVVHDVL
jgi:predicted AAA+ superfamily ATPase